MTDSITRQVTVPDGPTIRYTVYKEDVGNFHAVILTETGSRGFMQSEVQHLSHPEVKQTVASLWLKAVLAWGTPESKEWAHLKVWMTRYGLIDYPERQVPSA